MYHPTTWKNMSESRIRIFSWLYFQEYMKVHTPILYVSSYAMLQKRKSTKKAWFQAG